MNFLNYINYSVFFHASNANIDLKKNMKNVVRNAT